jgi:predicted amidophosphoribosyltransferase
LPAYKCTCVPKTLNNQYKTIPALCFYEADGSGVQNKTIYTLKNVRNNELISYLAFELYPHIANELEENNISRNSVVFTWIPRRSSAIAKYGFDQGKLIADALSKLFGCRAYPLYIRIGGREQKKLDTSERNTNLRKSVVLNHNLIGFPRKETSEDIEDFLTDKNVVIVDDILTTGSTLSYGIELLNSVFKGKIVIATVAKTKKKK